MQRTFTDIRPVQKHQKHHTASISHLPSSKSGSLKSRPKIKSGFFKNLRFRAREIFAQKIKEPKISRRASKNFFQAWGIKRRSITAERIKKNKAIKSQKSAKKRSGFFQKLRHQSADFWAGVKNLNQRDRIGFHQQKVKKVWHQRWWFNFIVIGFFIGVALVMTYPLITHFRTSIPGDGGDNGLFLWDSFWVKHALVDLHQSPFYTDLIAFPHRVDLTFHTLALFNSVASVPFQLIFGLIPAFNLIFLAGFVLTGWGTYLLIKFLTKNILAGLISGVMLAFAPYVMVRSLGHFNLSTIWPIPFFLFFLMRMLYKKGWHNAILAGLFAGILCLNELQYAVLIVFFSLLIYIVYLIAEAKRFLISTFLIKSVIMILVALIVFSPLLIPALKGYQENQLEKISLDRYQQYSADLVRFVVPSHLSTFFGDWAYKVKSVVAGGGTEGTVFLGYTVLALVLSAIIFAAVLFQLRKHKKIKKDDGKMRIWTWFSIAVVFLILAMGPILHFWGKTEFQVSNIHFKVPLPFVAIYQIPFIGDLRAPSRFSIFAMVCLVVIAGIALAQIFRFIGKIKWKWLKGLITGIIFLLFFGAVFGEFLSTPLRMENAVAPKIYDQIKKDPADCTILDLPCGFATGYYGFGNYHGIEQSYQSVHGKKLVSALISRFPAKEARKYLTLPGLHYLVNYQEKVTTAPNFNRRKIQQTFRSLNVKYIVLHKKYFGPLMEERLKLYLTKVAGLSQFYEDNDTIGYVLNRDYLPQIGNNE